MILGPLGAADDVIATGRDGAVGVAAVALHGVAVVAALAGRGVGHSIAAGRHRAIRVAARRLAAVVALFAVFHSLVAAGLGVAGVAQLVIVEVVLICVGEAGAVVFEVGDAVGVPIDQAFAGAACRARVAGAGSAATRRGGARSG